MQRCAFTPYEGNEPYIFISYAHKDSKRVYPILEELHRRGYRVWYDDGIAPGSEWPENIAQHLSGCALTIAFISPSSIASDNCRREVTFALSKRKPFLGIILEPTEMSLGMEMQLSAQQCIMKYSYTSEESFYTKVCSCPDLKPCLKPAKVQEQPASAPAPVVPTPTPVPAPAPVAAPKPKKEPAQLPAFLQNKKLLGIIAGGVAAVVLILILIIALGGKDQGQTPPSSTGQSTTGPSTTAQNQDSLVYADQTITAAQLEAAGGAVEMLQFTNCVIESGALENWELPATLKQIIITDCTGVTALRGLENLENLEHLDLRGSDVADTALKPLKTKNLRYADLSGNAQFSDLSIFANCAKLEELNFSDTAVSSVESLRSMEVLKHLRGSRTKVTDIAPLTALIELRTLEFSGCGIAAIDGKFCCLYLEELDISNNLLEDLQAFTNCAAMRRINVSYNDLYDTDLLKKSAATLESLNVSGNSSIYDWDLKFVAQCPNLKQLWVDGLHLGNLNFLKDAVGITHLSAVYCRLNDISGVAGLQNLQYLNLANNYIQDLSPLSGLQSEAPIVDLSFNGYLQDLSGLPTQIRYGVLNLTATSVQGTGIPQFQGTNLILGYWTGLENPAELKEEFGHIYIVDPPMDKIVALENRFGKDRVTFVADVQSYLVLLEAQGIDCTCLATLLAEETE